jgi:hypothetical protein
MGVIAVAVAATRVNTVLLFGFSDVLGELRNSGDGIYFWKYGKGGLEIDIDTPRKTTSVPFGKFERLKKQRNEERCSLRMD